MPRYFDAVFTAGSFALAMLVFSCKKNVEPSLLAENISAPKVDKELKKCQIKRITTSYDPYHGPATFTFEYNKKGDPVAVKPSFISEGSTNWLFRYDSKHRLTDFIGAPRENAFEFWQKYVYDDHSRAIKDTIYVWGSFAPESGPLNWYSQWYSDYEYDQQGRISLYTMHSANYPGSFIETRYLYDANGNLVMPGFTYDNKISLFRTNEIWMFITRNYSRNNAIVATSYNSSGLPLGFNAPIPSPLFSFNNSFDGWVLNNSVIEYDCKGNDGTIQ
jgi:hypothetical protein